MIAPKGYINFFEVADWAREIARDIAWAKRRVTSDDGSRIEQIPGERDALECWAMANLFKNSEIEICSPVGSTLRAPPFLNMHLDQIEMLPIPIPIEHSSLTLPLYGKSFEIAPHQYFRDRFAFFSWDTGCVDTSSAEGGGLVGANGPSQFSKPTTRYLKERQAQMVDALNQYRGWSICLEPSEFGETTQDLYAAFGVDEYIVDRLNLRDEGFFKSFFEPSGNWIRKRDKALQAYEERFPNGHESEGLTIKEATNEVSELLEVVISIDTLRRALGKKK